MTPSVVSKATAPLPFLSLACEAARRLGAVGVLILAEGPMDWDVVRVLSQQRDRRSWWPAPRSASSRRSARRGLVAIEVEPTEVAISERISLALIEAVANDLLQAGARVVVVYSGFEAEALDSLTVIRLGEHLERLTARDLRALETSVPFETSRRSSTWPIEIGREGREGKAVGTLIVVGDARNVMARTRQLGFDPFKGYRRKERNVRDFRVREAIKEIAQLDGAFVVARDGTVEAACRLIDAPDDRADAPQGPGHAPLGGRRDHRGHQGRGRRRQPVQRHRPAVPERRCHPPHRPHAPRPRHEMARRRDRARPVVIRSARVMTLIVTVIERLRSSQSSCRRRPASA